MKIIHVHGRARVAYPDGERIERQEDIFVPSEQAWFQTIDTDNHFVYRQGRKRGSTLLCTCGGMAGVYNYEAYAQFSSINRGRIVACVTQMETKKHADGST